MRLGTLALIMPVMTSTDGPLRRQQQVDADRARLLREADDRVLDLGRRDHHEVGELVDHDQHVGQRRLAVAQAHAVHLGQVARLVEAHQLVALLHLAHDVLEHRGGVLHVRDDGREQVRNRLVVVELDLLRVDQDHPHLVRRRAQQDRAEHRVDAARLARAGRAGDQQVRHAREVGDHGLARDVLAEPDGQRRAGRGLVDEVAERDEVRRAVRHLDADRLLARDRREDADLGRRERVGEVVAQRGDARDLRARGELQLVARHARARDRADQARLHAVLVERGEQRVADALDVDVLARRARAALQHARVGQPVVRDRERHGELVSVRVLAAPGARARR